MFRLLCLIALSRVSGWLSAFVAVQAMGKRCAASCLLLMRKWLERLFAFSFLMYVRLCLHRTCSAAAVFCAPPICVLAIFCTLSHPLTLVEEQNREREKSFINKIFIYIICSMLFIPLVHQGEWRQGNWWAGWLELRWRKRLRNCHWVDCWGNCKVLLSLWHESMKFEEKSWRFMAWPKPISLKRTWGWLDIDRNERKQDCDRLTRLRYQIRVNSHWNWPQLSLGPAYLNIFQSSYPPRCTKFLIFLVLSSNYSQQCFRNVDMTATATQWNELQSKSPNSHKNFIQINRKKISPKATPSLPASGCTCKGSDGKKLEARSCKFFEINAKAEQFMNLLHRRM